MKLNFPAHPHCTACLLHAQCETAGLPTRPWSPLSRSGFTPLCTPSPSRLPKAVLIIGEAPGREEDTEGRCFVGRSGWTLDRVYVQGTALPTLADIYLTNAVRCRPWGNSDPPARSRNICRKYLIDDIRTLQEAYSEVVLLCVGGPACLSVLGTRLKTALRTQGSIVSTLSYPEEEPYRKKDGTPSIRLLKFHESFRPCPVFTTYHPAFLLSQRNPAAIHHVDRHLQLLVKHLKGIPCSLPESTAPPLAVAPPDDLSLLALDIETYGFIEGQPSQRMFHPAKSAALDGAPPDKLIACIALAWRPAPSAPIATTAFLWSNPSHIRTLSNWLRVLKKNAGTLLLMNCGFDLQYLLYTTPALRPLLSPSLRIMDISVLNYLANETRPERSLKNLGPLYSITHYETTPDMTFRAPSDPALLSYCAQDAACTLALAEQLEEEIERNYPNSPKLSEYARSWWSSLLWEAVRLGGVGLTMDLRKLHAVCTQLTRRMSKLHTHYLATYRSPICGKGSQKALSAFMHEAVTSADLWDSPMLETTKKTQALSTGKTNLHLVLHTLTPRKMIEGDSAYRLWRQARAIEMYRRTSKLLSTYVLPMTDGTAPKEKDRDQCRVISDGSGVGTVYPSIYVVPSAFANSDSDEGGTPQARWSLKKPAVQNFPPIIERCITSRYTPGIVLHADYSQLELAVAAFLSNDPVMLAEHMRRVDLHTEMAKTIFGEDVEERLSFRQRERQAGKKQNFRRLYRGGIGKFRLTLMLECGFDLSWDRCEEIDRLDRAKYPTFYRWQDEWIGRAKRDRKLILPLIGESRRFSGTPAMIAETYTNLIVNFPVQTVAARIMQSAQITLSTAFASSKLSAAIVRNIHDAIDIDLPSHERSIVEDHMRRVMPLPPYAADLEEHYSRKIPLFYKTSVLAERRL